MHSLNLFHHEFFVVLSFVACIVGLWMLWNDTKSKDKLEETERILFRMCFSYWLVYCVAFGIEKLVLPEWDTLVMSLRITTALSYFLTFSCVLSLPLHKFTVRQVED